MYSQTKQDIKNLRHLLVVTYVGSNHANFQRFWLIDKGAESFEIRPPTVHSNFTISIVAVETVETHYTTRSAEARNIYLSLICVSYAYSKKWEVLLCISTQFNYLLTQNTRSPVHEVHYNYIQMTLVYRQKSQKRRSNIQQMQKRKNKFKKNVNVVKKNTQTLFRIFFNKSGKWFKSFNITIFH